jgi:hypothetical protein
MKFGIFIFGDNHPELQRSNQAFCAENLTIGEWAEELCFLLVRRASFPLVWDLPSPPMLVAAVGQ